MTISIPRPPACPPARATFVELLALAFEHARFIYIIARGSTFVSPLKYKTNQTDTT